MIQGLVNSFGTAVMAAFAAAVKIDSFAYMPVQEFGNAFSTFIAQNFRAKRYGRIRRGVRSAAYYGYLFDYRLRARVRLCRTADADFRPSGRNGNPCYRVEYLRIEGAFYCGIGILFHLLYGYYQGCPEAGDVGSAHGDFAGHSRGAFLPTGGYSFCRGNGHLVVYSHRLAAGRRGGYAVL